MLTSSFSEVDRAERVAQAKADSAPEIEAIGRRRARRYIARHYPAYWLKVDLPHKVLQARYDARDHQTSSYATACASMPRAASPS